MSTSARHYWYQLRGWLAALVAVLLVVGLVGVLRDDEVPTRSVTATFDTVPGLFEGNRVSILGMAVGKVTSVEPGPGGVQVRFDVPRNLPLPADVKVMLMAPNLISDRFLALDPPYTQGARLTDPAVIPRERTAVPLSADQIIASVDRLAQALGPNGANAKGDLNNLLTSVATAFGPDGKPLNDTITNFGQALGALGAQDADLTQLFNSLGQLTTTASQNLDSYRAFSSDLASVSATLAGERDSIGTALSTLQQALVQLSTFVTDNAATLSGSLQGLNTFAASLSRQQAALSESFRTGGTALANLSAAVDRSAPGGPALRVRFDPSAASPAFAQEVCGNSVLRLLTLALANKDGGTYDGKFSSDVLCGLNGVVQQLPPAPGSGSPDLTKLAGG